MALDRGDRPAVSDATTGRQIGRPAAVDLLRSLVIVGLAIFAILVLLPAAIAAQAAVAI